MGPGISHRSKAARVANEWKITKYLYNGVDLTAAGDEVSYTFDKDGDFNFSDGVDTYTGKWALIDDNEEIEYYFDVDPTEKYSYEIIKLKEKEMKWSPSLNGETEEITFEPK